MSEDHPPRKKRLGLLKRSRSNPHLAEEGDRRAASDPSSLPPSRNGSRKGLSGLVPKFLGKVTDRFARSARQSPNPDPTAASSSAQDLLHPHTSKDLQPLTTIIAPEPNPDQSSDLRIVKSENPDPKVVKATLAIAKADLEGIRQVSGIVENTASSSNHLQSVPDTIDSFSKILGPFKVFNSVATGLAHVHPYAKVALSIFTCASKMILDQANRDAAVSSLLSKISDVYALLMERDGLARIASMLEIYGKIARQTLECADFVVHYSDMKSFWRRLGKHVFNETEAAIQRHNEVLDNLMQQFRDQLALTTIETVHRIAEDLDVSGMEYVPGAGRNTSKNCLPGTREDILSEIKCWVRSTGEDVPRVLWLSGTAGKGKSAIAHTIANWSYERGGMRACFCFDRTREAERRHEKIFTTIARDLADCDITMRGALARAVHDDNELKHTIDISRQWQELVVGPIGEASKAITAPVLIVIDALDESGNATSREWILRLLAGDPNTSSQLSQLPANFRVIVTSRPLEDIGDVMNIVSHIYHISMDEIPIESTDLDIQVYISTMLKHPRNTFEDRHFKTLAQKSDGLFEWARLACDYIKGTNKVGLDPMERFDAVITGTSETGTRLLDDMYERILTDSIPEKERREAIPVFCSVMGQILTSLEPLPMTALAVMRQHFSSADGRYKVDRVIGPLSSLLTGTADLHTPIRPLHASFYDFLTDKSRSRGFFVDGTLVQGDLAFASLRVMDSDRGLRFNICSLENSYLPNSSVPDLEERVKEYIPAELSYSCRFWGTHVAAISFESSLANEVEAFFNGERLLWWLEALALMKNLGGSVATLSCIADWFSGHAEFTHVSDASRDTLRFVRTFATIILHSTPHLYLSALPFAPTQSRIYRKFASKFPRTPCIVAGHVENWPQMEKILHANDEIYSVALSPDGKCIACGLLDGTIQVWDIETGQALCAPLQGHTRYVMSVAFSPDGHRIISGSYDKTVRVWDAKTGEALGSPLQGHTSYVWSVTISPDGKCIVSGSDDNTIQVWDMETGEAFGPPLQGHTSGVRCVTISPDGKRIVSGSQDSTIRVWDMETGKPLGAPLQGHVGTVLSVAISPDGKRIVSGSSDETIRVWDMETGEAFGAPLKGHTRPVKSVAILSDGNHIVSGSYDQTIRVWDAKTGEAVGSPLQGHTKEVWSVAISPNGNRIVSGSDDKTIRVWDADTIMGKASVAALESHTASVNAVAISLDGCSIVSGSDDTTVRVWDIETGKALVAPLKGHSGSVLSVAISLDGKGIVSGSADKSIRTWNAETGEASGVSLQGHTDYVRSVAISPDRNYIVSGSHDKTIRVWHIETGEIYALSGHLDWVASVAISSNGNRIVSGSYDETIRVWDMGISEASSAPLQCHSDYVLSVAISPDSCHIVSGSRDTTIRVWDMGTGELLGAPLKGHTSWVNTVAISSDGNRIVSGSDDQTVQVWDMKTGKAVCAPFRGHTGRVLSVAISPDGKHIVSGSFDKTIRVWDLEFLIRHQSFEAPTICFSSNPTHALQSASSFLHDSKTSAPSGLNEEGWVVGPEGRLLLWIPLNFYPVTYAAGNTLVIANNALQLDLSRVAHGTSWRKCREQ
ncbi:WD40 repeat-like protein [Suillus weaverae]|nr:WD40 repeat-like protein [Suillus weaverae]